MQIGGLRNDFRIAELFGIRRFLRGSGDGQGARHEERKQHTFHDPGPSFVADRTCGVDPTLVPLVKNLQKARTRTKVSRRWRV